MMTQDGLIFEANSLKQGRLQALTRQQLQAQATQNRERRWATHVSLVPESGWPLPRRGGGSSDRRTLGRAFCLRGGKVLNQAGEKADQIRISLDSDPLVHPVDPLQIVRRDA